MKEPITVLVAFAVCRVWDFDALSVILVKDRTQIWGHFISSLIIAGGSKASIKLFHDVMNTMSSAEQERQKLAKAEAEAKAEAKIPAVRVAPPFVPDPPDVPSRGPALPGLLGRSVT